jgi:glycosyltransferase involved in cell wall biosynthesis
MYQKKKIAVVVPCYNEQNKIAGVIKSMPEFVDVIYVIDDVSSDDTVAVVKALQGSRVELICHQRNSGVGAAIATGYQRVIESDMDIAVVMAGDGQMDPDDLASVIQSVVDGQVDYCKGNRFFHSTPVSEIPRHRFFGNLVLSALTKIVSGYWHVSDTQCGYTAINRAALEVVNWGDLYPRYGCPNDILVQLNIAEMRVGEVPVAPLYGLNWESKMKPLKVFMPILWLLLKRYIKRCVYRYAINNGHPLIFYLGAAAALWSVFLVLAVYVVMVWASTGLIPKVAFLTSGFVAVIGTQLILAAFSLDYDINQPICIDLKKWQKQGTS